MHSSSVTFVKRSPIAVFQPPRFALIIAVTSDMREAYVVGSQPVGGFIVFVIVFVIILLAKAAKTAAPGGYDALAARGIPARGILLRVSSTGTKVGTRLRRFEVRQGTIDVEIPGREPYEINAAPVVPLNLVRDVLPGATVELRVDPKNPANMAIIGPGTGFVQQALRTA